jgi:hypothetical protein
MQHSNSLPVGVPTAGAPLDRVRRLEPEYRQSRARFFPTLHSLQWFLRRHKARLIDAGAIVMHGGQWYADEAKFDAVLMAVAQERAREVGGVPADDQVPA